MLLRAVNVNWGLRTAQDWQYTEFELSEDGELHIKVFFLYPVLDKVVHISTKDMLSIKGNLKKTISDPPDVFPDACDGEAWAFDIYDEDGKITYKREKGYIYGVDVLEEIGEILNCYIPEYEKPHYTKEDIDRCYK